MVPMAAGCLQVAAILHCAALATPLPTHTDQLWRARLSGFPVGVDKRPFPWTGLGFRLLGIMQYISVFHLNAFVWDLPF